MNISGQCHCGAITFTALVDASKVVACHCADCQQFSGAPFRAVIPVPAQNVKLTGQPKHYVKVGSSGARRAQAFCGECGTHLYATEADTSTVLNLRLGCVNERAQLPPLMQIWGESAQPWLPSLPITPMRAQGPASPVMDAAALAERWKRGMIRGAY